VAILLTSETYGILACGRLFTSRNAKGFSYNKRTYNGIGNDAFFAPLAIRRINNLCAVNTLNSSTPVASINISFIIMHLHTRLNFVQ
jgi:hypothetical protein